MLVRFCVETAVQWEMTKLQVPLRTDIFDQNGDAKQCHPPHSLVCTKRNLKREPKRILGLDLIEVPEGIMLCAESGVQR
jgi:hypothetical protein